MTALTSPGISFWIKSIHNTRDLQLCDSLLSQNQECELVKGFAVIGELVQLENGHGEEGKAAEPLEFYDASADPFKLHFWKQ